MQFSFKAVSSSFAWTSVQVQTHKSLLRQLKQSHKNLVRDHSFRRNDNDDNVGDSNDADDTLIPGNPLQTTSKLVIKGYWITLLLRRDISYMTNGAYFIMSTASPQRLKGLREYRPWPLIFYVRSGVSIQTLGQMSRTNVFEIQDLGAVVWGSSCLGLVVWD